MLEQVQTDIWVRFQKSRGHDCLYVCADDAHGTAIMLTAEKLGITPEQQIDNMRQEHERDSAGFLIGFDNFHTTHSKKTATGARRFTAPQGQRPHRLARDHPGL